MAPRDDRPEIKFHDAPGMPDPGFYAHAVSLNQANRLVFTSGIIAQRLDGSFPESLEDQVKSVYENLKEVLKKSGATPRNVIKVTFYPVDWSLDQGEILIKPFLDFITDEYGTTYRPITTLIPVTKLAMPEAKLEIEAVAAIGGHASQYAGPSIRSFDRPVPPFKVDVVVVGGGFSGVQAAWDIQKAGLSCVLLEAKHRIGGRSRSQQLQSGPGIVELGATWINKKTQPIVYATAKRLGLDIVDQYVEGDEIWQMQDGTILRTSPDSVSRRTGRPFPLPPPLFFLFFVLEGRKLICASVRRRTSQPIQRSTLRGHRVRLSEYRHPQIQRVPHQARCINGNVG